MKYIIGIGGVTNGGKTTLTNRLIKALPNCCVVHQDDFYKPQDQIEVGEDGFKQWDALESLDMDAMVNTVQAWIEKPRKFARSHGVNVRPNSKEPVPEEIHILVIEGFLLYNYNLEVLLKDLRKELFRGSSLACVRQEIRRDDHNGPFWPYARPLTDLFNKCYYLTVPYDECKRRRSTRHYPIPDPPGLFDGHVWPMYLKYRKEMETHEVDAVYLDGLKSRDDLYNQVFEEIQNMLFNCS